MNPVEKFLALGQRIHDLEKENERLKAYNDRLLALNEKLMTVWADQNEMLLEHITNPNPTDHV